MAHWNSFFSVPNQNDSFYEEQNLNSQPYFQTQNTYGGTSSEPFTYSLFEPSNVYSNMIPGFGNTIPNVQDLEHLQFQNYNETPHTFANIGFLPGTTNINKHMDKIAQQNANLHLNQATSTSATVSSIAFSSTISPSTSSSAALLYTVTPSVLTSTLTPTAAEFKPSSSNVNYEYDRGTIQSNTVRNRTGAVRKSHSSIELKNQNNEVNFKSSSSDNWPDSRKMHKTNSGKYFHEDKHKQYSKYDYAANRNFNDTFDNPFQSDAAMKPLNKLNKNKKYAVERAPETQNDHWQELANHRDLHTNKNSYDRDNFSRDKYKKSQSKKIFLNRTSKGYDNWRNSTTTEEQENKSEAKVTERNIFSDRVNRLAKDRKQTVKDDYKSQRARLTEQVNLGNLECLVCCEQIKQIDRIWHCQKCFHIFHFRCITKWGFTSKDDKGWRCPACQFVYKDIPKNSYCYCGKTNNPVYCPEDIAHSCGEICGRVGAKPDCEHRCNLLCHPGPCPKCEIQIIKNCCCGATQQLVKCSVDTAILCTNVCNKLLKCNVHRCTKICHANDCEICLIEIHQDCYCGKSSREIPCSLEEKDVTQYSCKQTCGKLLSCGNHKCNDLCHPGDCKPCLRAPELVKTCPCGKKELEVTRTCCLDPIPCCGQVCQKRYPRCGNINKPHICKSNCHEGDCPPCTLTTFVRCRCGNMNCEISCVEFLIKSDVRCKKKCTKKRSCGKHKCNQLCCIDIEHICPVPCNHILTCGLHRCEQTCHNGRCRPCWRNSFEELYCECGSTVIYPPVPCGTKRPHCTEPCSRQHNCEHEPLHTCHSQAECPPCTVFTSKLCYGGHEKRNTIPCHQKEFSCGLPCGKELQCGRHKCQLPCHKGPCLKAGQNCTQPCTFARANCGHPCGLPCHELPCPESPCKELVKVTCQCGLRSSSRACADMAGEYQRIATSMLASKMADMQLGHSIDIGDIIGASSRRQTLKTLECNDECRLVERNRRLAIGLQIRNPDLSSKLTPRYSDFMRQWAKKDAVFCQMVHDKLTELVQLAKQSKQKSRSYSFPSMNRDKRQFVHEYCEHFGCESAAYDKEPNRNVVATAARDKAWLPSCSLLELIQRESGQRKVPGPILNRPLGSSKVSETVSLKVPIKAQTPTMNPSTSFSSALQNSKPAESEIIDYFNYPSLKK